MKNNCAGASLGSQEPIRLPVVSTKEFMYSKACVLKGGCGVKNYIAPKSNLKSNVFASGFHFSNKVFS
jgi:hypothetical protein